MKGTAVEFSSTKNKNNYYSTEKQLTLGRTSKLHVIPPPWYKARGRWTKDTESRVTQLYA